MTNASQRQLLDMKDMEFEREEIMSGDYANFDLLSDADKMKAISQYRDRTLEVRDQNALTKLKEKRRMSRMQDLTNSLESGPDLLNFDGGISKYTKTMSKKSMHKILNEEQQDSMSDNGSGYSSVSSGESEVTKRTKKGRA